MPVNEAKNPKSIFKRAFSVALAIVLAGTLCPGVGFALDANANNDDADKAATEQATAELTSITINKDATRPNWTSDWCGYTNGGNASTTAKTPTGKAKASWTFNYAEYASSTWASCSEPILAGDFVYVAVNNKIAKINKTTGGVAKEADLNDSISYTSRPVYTNGLIVVPLNGGAVQALTADNLTTTWLTDKVNSSLQTSCTTTVDGDYVYVGSSTFSSTNGCLQKINTKTGEVAWQIEDESDGFYWNGAGISGDCIVISTTKGNVRTINRNTGSVVSALDLKTTLNTDCIMSKDGLTSYMMTRDGQLIVLSLDSSGKITGNSAKNIGLTGSTSSPTIVNGNLFVGGEVDSGSSSALAVVNLSNFNYQLIKTADGSALLGGGIKGAPLVSTTDAGTYVYFTVNNAVTTDWINYTAGGGVYSYKLGDSDSKLIYDPTGHNQYCDSPVICDAQGDLYYINDSGTLFKLTSAEESKSDDSDKTDDDSNKKDNTNNNNNNNNKNNSNNTNNNNNKKNNSNNNNNSNNSNNNSSNYDENGNYSNDYYYYYDDSYYDSDDYDNDDSDYDDSEESSDDSSSDDSSSGSADTVADIEQSNGLPGLGNNNDNDIAKASATPDSHNTKSKFWWIPYFGIGVGVILIAGSTYLMLNSRKKNNG